MRKVRIRNQQWLYMVGKSNAVIWSPSGKKHVVPLNTLTGKSWDTIERGRYKRTNDCAVYPMHIRRYIDKVIMDHLSCVQENHGWWCQPPCVRWASR